MTSKFTRNFQPPASAGAAHAQPKVDCEVPEINTNFIDNLWHDSTFVDKFDASFDKTVPMELQAEPPKPDAPGADLLDVDFQNIPRK